MLIAVAACGVNYPDALVIEDRYQFKPPRPFSPGGEISGTIVGLGEGVTSLKVGERVLTPLGSSGGMAEKAVADARRVMPIPARCRSTRQPRLTYHLRRRPIYALKDRGGSEGRRDAAGAGRGGRRRLGGGRTRQSVGRACHRGSLQRGEGRQPPSPAARTRRRSIRRARSTATAAKQLAELFKHACGKNGADVIYDAVGGDYCEAALRAIAWEGRLLVIGFPAGHRRNCRSI